MIPSRYDDGLGINDVAKIECISAIYLHNWKRVVKKYWELDIPYNAHVSL